MGKNKKRKSSAASKPAKRKETGMELLSSMAMMFATALFIITFDIQAFEIPTSSMENTLLIGDHVFVDRITTAPPTSWAIFEHQRAIRHGDIIVFFSVETPGLHLVKRVIGVAGDRIKIINQQIYRNGVKQNEPYVYHKNPYPDSFRDNFPSSEPNLMLLDRAREMLANNVVNGEVVVPPNSFFAMGDNRDNSLDSRYWGLVPRENITGKPLIVFWSYDAPTEDLKDYNLHHLLDLSLHFFTKTRWDRTLKLIHGYPLG